MPMRGDLEAFGKVYSRQKAASFPKTGSGAVSSWASWAFGLFFTTF